MRVLCELLTIMIYHFLLTDVRSSFFQSIVALKSNIILQKFCKIETVGNECYYHFLKQILRAIIRLGTFCIYIKSLKTLHKIKIK